MTEFSVALCLKCAHYGAKRALPSGKIIPVKGVPIIEGWCGPLTIAQAMLCGAFMALAQTRSVGMGKTGRVVR